MNLPFSRPPGQKVNVLKDNERQRVEVALTRRYLETGLIAEIADDPSKKPKSTEEKHKNRLSKALAAYTVSRLCQLSDQDGTHCLVDGEEDNGIDAVHIVRQGDDTTVYLIQAKFQRGEPDRDEDIHPFVQGVRELLDGNYANFRNPLFLARKDEVEEAVNTPGVQLVLVFTHLGRGVENHALTVLTEFCQEEALNHIDINGQLIHAALLADERPKGIRAELTLRHHRYTDSAPKVAYGLVKVQQLAELFHLHGTLLFDQNIRSFLGRGVINNEILASLRSTPQLFAQYNNGITIICQKLKTPTAKNKTEGRYNLRGLSIVNGAQTVGSIAQAIPAGDPDPPDAFVMVTIIETQGAGDTFAVDVTRTRNTQNPIPREAFAAQDTVNEHLRTHLATLGIHYVYKPGQDSRDADCTLEDVANALATFSDDPTDALTRDVVDLLNIRSAAYQRLFGPLLKDVDPERLFRMVQFFRQTDATLQEYRQGTIPKTRERMFYSVMRPLTRYWIARRSRVIKNGTAAHLTPAEKTALSRDIETFSQQVLQLTFAYSEEHNRGILAISNSPADCRNILSNLEQAWVQQRRQTHEAQQGQP